MRGCVGVATTVTAVFCGYQLGFSLVIHCVSFTGIQICDGDAVALPKLSIYHHNLTFSFEL